MEQVDDDYNITQHLNQLMKRTMHDGHATEGVTPGKVRSILNKFTPLALSLFDLQPTLAKLNSDREWMIGTGFGETGSF